MKDRREIVVIRNISLNSDATAVISLLVMFRDIVPATLHQFSRVPSRNNENGVSKYYLPPVYTGIFLSNTDLYWIRGSINLSNVGILPHHYTESQPRRPRLESLKIYIRWNS